MISIWGVGKLCLWRFKLAMVSYPDHTLYQEIRIPNSHVLHMCLVFFCQHTFKFTFWHSWHKWLLGEISFSSHVFNRIFWEICYTRFYRVLLYKVAIKNINDNRISTSIQSFPVSKFGKPFLDVLLTPNLTTWKAPNFQPPKNKISSGSGYLWAWGFSKSRFARWSRW